MKDTPPLDLPPSSLVALAAAAQRASSSVRKPATPSAHRRSQTIVVAGELELEQIHKHKIVEELHSELESKSKELEESQEEAQLAARIGQTLLQRNQEMGVESESKATELLARAETAEHELHLMESRLDRALAHARALETARTRATLEAEQLTQELDEARTQHTVAKSELTRAHEELRRAQQAANRLEEELEARDAAISAKDALCTRLQAEVAAKNERIEVLLSTERYNVEHISRLEIENQLICQQHHVLVDRERQLQFEYEAVAARQSAQTQQLKQALARNHELEATLAGLQGEMEELRDSLTGEQKRVRQVTRRNQDLQDALERQKQPHDGDAEDDEPATQQLRTGSLFHELSRQLHSELQAARLKQQQLLAASPAKALDSPAASSTRTSRNPSSNNTDSLHDGEEAPPSRPPPLALRSPEEGEDSMLKEFFLLTAAAVKSGGGGLRNDACNILNEDLYAEAMAEGVSFDQFHRWLERRLEDDLALSTVEPSIKKPAKDIVAPVPPTPSRSGSSFLFFWARASE